MGQGRALDYIAQLSGRKPAMLVSSVQAIVTAPRVCTLVLFISISVVSLCVTHNAGVMIVIWAV